MNKKTSFLTIFLVAITGLHSVLNASAQVRVTPRNLILFISDGAGPASFTMTREYKRLVLNEGPLALDPWLIGTVRTHSSNKRISDSAASASAFSTGIKTYKDFIAVDTTRRAVASIVDAAERQGKWTGIVSTSGITDATPAAFSAHIDHRDKQTQIARQQLRHGIELLLGGGRGFFLPESAGGKRTDRINLINTARDRGYQYVSNRSELLGDVSLPLLGLFTDDHMAFEIDKARTDEPSFVELTMTAINLLSSAEEGFVLIIETEGTDDAGHDNDAAANIHELLAYDEAFAFALDFAGRDGQTLLVAVSDHDAGGLSVGRGGYMWQPEILHVIDSSVAFFYRELGDRVIRGDSFSSISRFAMDKFASSFGIEDLTDEQTRRIHAVIAHAISRDRNALLLSAVRQLLIDEISKRAGVAWTTRGHTGVDVNIYAFGPGSGAFRGNMDNAVMGQKLAEAMGFDLAAETARLRH